MYPPREFAKMIGRSVQTLQRWDRDGILVAKRTPTNRRYYTEEDYQWFLSGYKGDMSIGLIILQRVIVTGKQIGRAHV